MTAIPLIGCATAATAEGLRPVARVAELMPEATWTLYAYAGGGLAVGVAAALIMTWGIRK